MTYADAHDNETLFDALAQKLPPATAMADRVRMQKIGLAPVLLGQGQPFLLAGTEFLRSKSLDRNSYDSGDWFNLYDPTLRSNGFGRGLPPAADNESKWPYMQPLLTRADLVPTPPDMRAARDGTLELLRIRQSSPLLTLDDPALVQQKLSFPAAEAGIVVAHLDDTAGPDLDPARTGLLVVTNPFPQERTVGLPGGGWAPIRSAQMPPARRSTPRRPPCRPGRWWCSPADARCSAGVACRGCPFSRAASGARLDRGVRCPGEPRAPRRPRAPVGLAAAGRAADRDGVARGARPRDSGRQQRLRLRLRDGHNGIDQRRVGQRCRYPAEQVDRPRRPHRRRAVGCGRPRRHGQPDGRDALRPVVGAGTERPDRRRGQQADAGAHQPELGADPGQMGGGLEVISVVHLGVDQPGPLPEPPAEHSRGHAPHRHIETPDERRTGRAGAVVAVRRDGGDKDHGPNGRPT